MIKNDPFKTRQDITKAFLKIDSSILLIDYIYGLQPPDLDDYALSLYRYFRSLNGRYPDGMDITIDDAPASLGSDFKKATLTFFNHPVIPYLARNNEINNVQELFEFWGGIVEKSSNRL